MKLNKQQIEALSSKISTELNLDITKFNSNLRENLEAKFLKTLRGKVLNKFIHEYPDLDNSSYLKQAINNEIFQGIKKEYDKKRKATLTYAQVYETVILYTIDCNDLNELLAKVKNTYAQN